MREPSLAGRTFDPAEYHPAPRFASATQEVKGIKKASDGWRFTAVLSTGNTDRDGERIKAEGWEFPPHDVPLFFGHAGYRDATNWIGAYEKTWVERAKLWGDGFIPDIEENWVGRKMGKFMRAGIAIPTSVGFDPLEWTNRDGKKGARQPGEWFDGGQIGRTYTRQTLLENSLVPVESNVGSIVTTLRAFGAIAGRDAYDSLSDDRNTVLALRSLLASGEASDTHRGERTDADDSEQGLVRAAVEEWVRECMDGPALFRAMARALTEGRPPAARRAIHAFLAVEYVARGLVAPELRSYSELELSAIGRWGALPFAGRETA